MLYNTNTAAATANAIMSKALNGANSEVLVLQEIIVISNQGTYISFM
ncbi:MAG: hypothetical protein GF383_03305 [Candidatus Lokiarchaeota archaeon]|nr:hypothetical protein [Candidatus Lokiarchaeota archaeon]MBD3338644.1 hypothetical protein [Candidatus Lokiarchaeota archaeon]